MLVSGRAACCSERLAQPRGPTAKLLYASHYRRSSMTCQFTNYSTLQMSYPEVSGLLDIVQSSPVQDIPDPNKRGLSQTFTFCLIGKTRDEKLKHSNTRLGIAGGVVQDSMAMSVTYWRRRMRLVEQASTHQHEQTGRAGGLGTTRPDRGRSSPACAAAVHTVLTTVHWHMQSDIARPSARRKTSR